MDYKMNIAGIDWSLPLCEVTEDLYIGAFILFGAAQLTEYQGYRKPASS